MGNYPRFGALSGDWGYKRRRIGDNVLMSCLAKNGTEKGELQGGYSDTCKANLIR